MYYRHNKRPSYNNTIYSHLAVAQHTRLPLLHTIWPMRAHTKSASQPRDYKYLRVRNPYARAGSATACPSPRTVAVGEDAGGSIRTCTVNPSEIRELTHQFAITILTTK